MSTAALSEPARPDPRTSRVAATLFREAMSLLASGLCVVTARGRDGVPCGLLVSSLCCYSVEPPSVLVCVQRGYRSHDALRSSESFGVHLLRHDQETLARTFILRGTQSKFADVEWDWDDGVPRLTGVLAYLRCARRTVFHHADHAIVIGEMTGGHISPAAPLCYFRRAMNWRLEQRNAARS